MLDIIVTLLLINMLVVLSLFCFCVLVSLLIFFRKKNKRPLTTPIDVKHHYEDLKKKKSAGEKKLAVLFLTRDSLHQGKPWFSFLKSGGDFCSVYGHAKHPLQIRQQFLKNAQIKRQIKTEWGTISLVKATLCLLREAFQDDKNEYFLLASESCMPIYDFKETYDYIKKINKSFIYNYNYKSDPTEAYKRWRRFRYYNFFWSIVKRKNLNIPENCFKKQSQWMLLRRDHVKLLLNNIHALEFSFVPAPDEHYFINVLNHYCPIFKEENVNYPLTLVDWVGGNGGHPNTFKSININEVKKFNATEMFLDKPEKPTNAKHLFVRKVWFDAEITK
jgi:hypothetical protein